MRPSNRAQGQGRTTVEAEFDEKALGYESNRLGEWYKGQGRWALEHVEAPAGPVLDVGCGTGWLLRELALRHPGARGVGVDLSRRMVEAAARRADKAGISGLSFLQADWEEDETEPRVLDALEGPASLVFCVSAFHYFEDPHQALARMVRVLTSGGRLLLLDRAMDGSPVTAAWDRVHRWLIKDGTRFYRTHALRGLLESAGFEDVEVLGRLNRLFWKGKAHTSLVLLSARKPWTTQQGET